MRRRLWTSLIGVVLIVIVTLAFNVATDNTPILGLDLQGGVSVILAPVEPASEQDLIIIRDLIRDELERQGIAEPDVRVQGQTIVVDLPGVRDQGDALSAVDVSGVVELRPVRQLLRLSRHRGTTTETAPPNGVDAPTTVPTSQAPTGTAVEPAGLRRPSAPPDRLPPTRFPPTRLPPTRSPREPHRPMDRSSRNRPSRVPNSCRAGMGRSCASARPRAPARCSSRAAQTPRSIRDGVLRSTCVATARPPGTAWRASVTTRNRPARRRSRACAGRSRSCSTASCSRRPR